jgi:hypothetical protein
MSKYWLIHKNDAGIGNQMKRGMQRISIKFIKIILWSIIISQQTS